MAGRFIEGFFTFIEELNFTMKKKLLILIFLLLFFSSCRNSSSSLNSLILSLNTDPLTLNPIIAQEMQSIEVCSFIFSPLLKYNEKTEIIGDLAESWQVKEKGRVWIFYLRKNVRWHDGMPFTAKDVEFTFNKLMDPSTNTFNRGLFQVNGKDIKFKAIDKYAVKAVLPEPFAPFPTYLTMMGIVPEHLLRNTDINRCEFNSSPVGTGPFKFRKWHHSDHIIIEPNKNYYMGPPKLDRIVFRIIPSAETQRIALKNGEVDQGYLKVEDLKFLKDLPHLIIYKVPSFMYFYMGFDLTNPLFQDRKVRKAINYAVDKKGLVFAVLQETGEPATGPIPKASWAYNPEVEKYNYNPEEAKKLLREAGWKINKSGYLEKDGRIFEFELAYPLGRTQFQKAAVLINSYLKEVGIKTNLIQVEFSVLIKKCNPGKFQAVLFDWVETFDPDCFVEWDSSQTGKNGMNFMSYSNPEADRLLREARSKIDTAVRKKLYYKFQEIVADDAPYVFLWYPNSFSAINKRIGGLPPPNPAGLFIYPEKIFIKGI